MTAQRAERIQLSPPQSMPTQPSTNAVKIAMMKPNLQAMRVPKKHACIAANQVRAMS
jgi:protein tyrosine phosphatase (PTP) superfamily phosphohydrolase (DUF442 family)